MATEIRQFSVIHNNLILHMTGNVVCHTMFPIFTQYLVAIVPEIEPSINLFEIHTIREW